MTHRITPPKLLSLILKTDNWPFRIQEDLLEVLHVEVLSPFYQTILDSSGILPTSQKKQSEKFA